MFTLISGTLFPSMICIQVLTRCRSILHDEETYPDPFVFNPSRYLDTEGNLRKLDKLEDPSFVAFGLGRRICPGMHLADATMFLYIASILHAFRIEKAVDEKGEPMDPVVDYDGFIRWVSKRLYCCLSS